MSGALSQLTKDLNVMTSLRSTSATLADRIANPAGAEARVYAEMSSSNSVYLLPVHSPRAPETIGRNFIGSLTMGAGQFCTNPGLVFALKGPNLERFLGAAPKALKACEPPPMLTPAIHKTYEAGGS
jgi:2,5-dioxopentanoate dehydrogenase